MRAILLTAAAAVSSVLALAACSPKADEPATANAPGQPEAQIESSTAPAIGGPAALPTDGGVTPAPVATADASAADVAAPVSPAEAAVRSGGEQGKPK